MFYSPELLSKKSAFGQARAHGHAPARCVPLVLIGFRVSKGFRVARLIPRAPCVVEKRAYVRVPSVRADMAVGAPGQLQVEEAHES